MKLAAESSGVGGGGEAESPGAGGEAGGDRVSPELADLDTRLRDLLPKVKDAVLNAKKPAAAAGTEPEDA